MQKYLMMCAKINPAEVQTYTRVENRGFRISTNATGHMLGPGLEKHLLGRKQLVRSTNVRTLIIAKGAGRAHTGFCCEFSRVEPGVGTELEALLELKSSNNRSACRWPERAVCSATCPSRVEEMGS
ncbi:hypothetical protein PILCRDRAFT_174488 [Piloderma croceum F 1598]|uniref:Uncharacterized protein n=1 Tax=Piloderma croceum (strain F 1598) TaxID=765440 RepID=A0A0C3CKJ6_PILCF|nr:hypothetical protein PILCRDRAFT_174488 [Piloderma croceum F 1598]